MQGKKKGKRTCGSVDKKKGTRKGTKEEQQREIMKRDKKTKQRMGSVRKQEGERRKDKKRNSKRTKREYEIKEWQQGRNIEKKLKGK